MKAVSEYLLMVVLMLLLSRVHVCAIFLIEFGQRNRAVKGLSFGVNFRVGVVKNLRILLTPELTK